ncbi:MAG: hypothetical protein H7263_12325 [Candidatus Sericytochromatia bacterium]|nr:hypothetical protein [Candidatus Sericytochromatia bacterium]
MNENSTKLIKSLALGSAFVGLGIYISRNKDLKSKISTKLQEGLKFVDVETINVQKKVKDTVDSTKESINKSISEAKLSLDEGVDKTSKQINDLKNRLSEAISAGKNAAQDSLKTSASQPIEKTTTIHNKSNNEMNIGATEDTSPTNSSVLHPATNNVSNSIGDASVHLEDMSIEQLHRSIK